MFSSVEYKSTENKYCIRGYFKNLYFIDGSFEYFSINKNISIKKIMTSKNEFLDVKVKYFENVNDIINYLSDKNINNINNITAFNSHFYDWNVAHGLYDTLYPLYLLLLHFFDNNIDFNIFLNLKYIPGWRFPGVASRGWVLNIFKTFCGGVLITDTKKNYKFDNIIIGHALSGISNVNKYGVMPGKKIFGLEKFRNRMYNRYNIDNNSNKNDIIIINSNRYSSREINELLKIQRYFIDNSYNCVIIDWAKITSFEKQLEIMKDTYIHISGAGSSMLNFPFLRNNAIHINMGVNKIDESNMPGLLEVNCCLLSNNIKCLYYDIFKHKEIKAKECINLIENFVFKKKEQDIPKYIKIWREYCIKDTKNIDDILLRMNAIKQPHLIGYRHPEMLIYEHYPYNKESNNLNNNLLNNIKEKYEYISNISQ